MSTDDVKNIVTYLSSSLASMGAQVETEGNKFRIIVPIIEQLRNELLRVVGMTMQQSGLSMSIVDVKSNDDEMYIDVTVRVSIVDMINRLRKMIGNMCNIYLRKGNIIVEFVTKM